MEYEKLGLTDLEVSRIGFGCWAMGGSRGASVDDSDSIQAVHEALNYGINFFDTADVYGFGHSEEILCKALGNYRNQVVIATKFGVKWDSDGNTSRDCSPARVVEALEGSLRRLKLDCIPLYQIHWPDPKTDLSLTLDALKRMQEAGKIKHIGCSNFPPYMINEIAQIARVESLQAPYNVVDRSIEKEILALCWENQISVLVYSPLAQGVLSGKFTESTRFKDADFRSKSANFQGVTYARNLALAEKLKIVGIPYGKSPSQVAIRWILDNPYITCVITGIRKPAQISENIGALDWHLSDDDKRILAIM